jgi:glycosyltransferase involved in cell wall biosynthesis
MKIAHVDTERGWRGGQQQVFSLVCGLRDRGHDNIVFARSGGELALRLKKSGIEVIEINPWGEFDVFRAGFVAIQLRHADVDIVHAHNAHGVALAALATLRNNIPFVLTRRVDFPIRSNLLSWWKYNRARKIIAISQAVADVLASSGISREKIELVPSGVDFTSFGGGGGLGVKWGSKVSPYASVGAEYAILKAKAGSLTLPDTKGMALQARLGVEFMVSSSVGIFAEGEYKHIFKSGAPRMIIANGGAMFHF